MGIAVTPLNSLHILLEKETYPVFSSLDHTNHCAMCPPTFKAFHHPTAPEDHCMNPNDTAFAPLPQPVLDALTGFYADDQILTRGARRIDSNQFEVSFLFPHYQRTLDSMGHVSAVQMHAALLEGLYVAVAFAIADGSFPAPEAGRNSFRRHRADFILFRQDVTFRRMLREGQSASLTIQIGELGDVTFLNRFRKLSFSISGFMQGTVECLLPKRISEACRQEAVETQAA